MSKPAHSVRHPVPHDDCSVCLSIVKAEAILAANPLSDEGYIHIRPEHLTRPGVLSTSLPPSTVS